MIRRLALYQQAILISSLVAILHAHLIDLPLNIAAVSSANKVKSDNLVTKEDPLHITRILMALK